MIKLFWTIVAWGLAAYSTYLWTTADPTMPYQLRDGLVVAGIALLLAIRIGKIGLISTPRTLGETFTTHGQILFWTGVICAIAGILLRMVAATDPVADPAADLAANLLIPNATMVLSAEVLWGMGRLLLLLTIVWPGAWTHAGHQDGPADRRGQHEFTQFSQHNQSQLVVTPRTVNWLSLSLILLVGLGTRLLVLSRLPDFCVGQVCELALAISDGATDNLFSSFSSTSFSLPILLARLFYRLTAESLLSIRLTTTLLALLALVGFYLLTRRLVSNSGALLGTLLIAFTPWYHTLDASTLPALMLLFWSTLGLWLLLTAWQRQQPRWALVGGVALGFATSLPLIQVALLFLLLLMTFLSLLPGNLKTDSGVAQPLTLLVALVGFIMGALPTFLAQGGLATIAASALSVLPFDGMSWLIALFQHGQLAGGAWTAIPPLTILMGSATLLGFGYLLRNVISAIAVAMGTGGFRPMAKPWIAQPERAMANRAASGMAGGLLAALPISGLTLAGLLFVYIGNSEQLAESSTLLFLFCAIVATIALEQLLRLVVHSWQALTPPPNIVAVAALVMVLLSIKPMLSLVEAGQLNRSNAETAIEQAMLLQIADLLHETPNTLVFAPATLRSNPAARLHLNDPQLEQLRPLSSLLNALYTSDNLHPLVYLVPAAAQPYLDLIARLQPGVTTTQALDPATGAALYTVVTADIESQMARQGLLGIAWERTAAGGNNSQRLPAFGPLQVTENQIPPLYAPFTIQWTGAIRIAIPGTYRFALEQPNNIDQPASNQPAISLQFDNQLVLDTRLGLHTQEISLVKGFYQVSLLYRVEPQTNGGTGNGGIGDGGIGDGGTGTETLTMTPRPFAITWQRPDGQAEIIPRNVLYSLPLQNVGLIGEYYRVDSAQSAPMDIRKDLLIGLLDERPEPYRVHWRGQLAAPRTGEYLLAALSGAGNVTQLFLDGRQILDSGHVAANQDAQTAPAQSAAASSASAYAEGTIYLTRGWHAIEIDYRPDWGSTEGASTNMQLFWQPPGSSPVPLASSYLDPAVTPAAESDLALPPALPLTPAAAARGTNPDPAIGDGMSAFALSYGVDYWQPQTQQPPLDLPLLSFEPQWQVGSCGSGPDQLAQPHGAALSAIRKLIYVVDSGNQRVIEYSWTGTINRIYTHPDWREPADITLIDAGFPTLLDAATQMIYNLNPATGAVEQRTLHTGFYFPRGLAADAFGNLLVADTGGARIVRLQPDGEPSYVFGGPETKFGRGQPTAVVEVNGLLWAITAEDGRLWQIESGGSYQAIEPTNTLNGPHLTALADGHFLLSDPARRRVLYLAGTGEPLAQIVLPGLVEPTGIAAALVDDLLYLAVVDTATCQFSFWRTSNPPAGLRQ